MLGEICDHVRNWDTIQYIRRVTAARLGLHVELEYSDPERYRDVVLLDIGLEIYARTLYENIIHLVLNVKHLMYVKLYLEHAALLGNDEKIKLTIQDCKIIYAKYVNTFESNKIRL